MNNRFLGRIFNYFVRGLILVAPLYITISILWYAVEYIDSILPIYADISSKKSVHLPGMGILVILVSIIFLGFIFSTIVPQSFFKYTEKLLRKIPLVSLIYYSIKDLISAFVGDKKKFNSPVLIKVFENSGIRKMGFITQSDLTNLNLAGHVAVYIPHSYAFSGELFIVPTDQVTVIDAASTDVMKMIVSGGVSVKDSTPL